MIAENETNTATDDEQTEDRSAADGSQAGSGEAGQPGEKRKMRWYVVQAYSGYENKVKASLEERIRQYNMQDDFGEILIPREQVTETRGTAEARHVAHVLSRLHVRADESDGRVVAPGQGHPQGQRASSAGVTPPPSRLRQINLVAQQVADGAAKPKPRVVFEQGDHVRVVEGAFANFTGTIEEVKPEKQKVRVLVSIFGRATPVELDYAQVEKTV